MLSFLAKWLRRAAPAAAQPASGGAPGDPTGARGEDLAAAHLRGLGWQIVERNFRGRGGEIDIVAMDGKELVFVEVKTRGGRRFGQPEEAVDRRKAACLSRAARDYWQQRRLRGLIVRCDVVAVRLDGDAPPEITLFRDAVPLAGEFL